MAHPGQDLPRSQRRLGRGLADVSQVFLSGAQRPAEAETDQEPYGERGDSPGRHAQEMPAAQVGTAAADPSRHWMPDAHYVVITSGRGVRGKTALAANLAWGLVRKDKKVSIVDADPDRPGLLDLTGATGDEQSPGSARTSEAFSSVPAVDLVGAPGSFEAGCRRAEVREAVEQAARGVQWVLIDGSDRSVVSDALLGLADLVVVVAEPAAERLEASYLAIKRVHGVCPGTKIGLVINMVMSYSEAEKCFRKLASVSRKFLKTNIRNLGFVVEDDALREACKRGMPVIPMFPSSRAAGCIGSIIGLMIMDAQAIARRRKEVTVEACALRRGR